MADTNKSTEAGKRYFTNQTRELMERMVATCNSTSSVRRTTLDYLLGGSRDLNFECGYPDSISINDYKYLYDREGVCRRVVTIFPEESWIFSPAVYEVEDEVETEFERILKDLNERTSIFYYLRRVDVLSGIGRYGILLFGIDDGKALDEPVDHVDLRTGEIVGTPPERKLLYIRAFSEDVLTIKERETDQTSPRFGRPTVYSVQMDLGCDGYSKNTVLVHWTRALHVADNREHSEIYGVPRMKADYNRLLDLRKTLAGSAEMFWKGGFPGYAVEVNPDYSDATLDTESIKDEMESFFNGLQRYMAMEGVTIKSFQPQTSDPSSHIEAQVKAICASRGIPYRIFLGSEKAELASTQDKKSWNERIRDRQNNYLTPMVVRPFIEWLMVLGVVPVVDDFIVVWPDRDAPSGKDIAEVARLRTEAMAKYVSGNVSVIMAPFEFFTKILGFSSEEAHAMERGVVDLEGEIDDGNNNEDDNNDNDEDDNNDEEEN